MEMNCSFPPRIGWVTTSDEVVKTKHALVPPILLLSPHLSLNIDLKMVGDTMDFGMEVGHALNVLQAHSYLTSQSISCRTTKWRQIVLIWSTNWHWSWWIVNSSLLLLEIRHNECSISGQGLGFGLWTSVNAPEHAIVWLNTNCHLILQVTGFRRQRYYYLLSQIRPSLMHWCLV